MNGELNIVTGAFGYSGSYIAHGLLERGARVRTLTAHPRSDHPLTGRIEAVPFAFDRADELARSLDGASVVFNNYWIRFPHGGLDFDRAVKNTCALIDAAKRASVRRFVHVSITNADTDLPLPYFRGKGMVENYLRASALSHAIVRPAVIFGPGEILLNNIAWLLRRFPAFAIPGNGEYRLQPVFVEDLARTVIDVSDARENVAMDAVGPEIFTFNDLVALIARTVCSRARLIHLKPMFALAAAKIVGMITRDVTLTDDEVRGLMANLLVSKEPPTAPAMFSEWLARNAAAFGTRYNSEIAKR